MFIIDLEKNLRVLTLDKKDMMKGDYNILCFSIEG